MNRVQADVALGAERLEGHAAVGDDEHADLNLVARPQLVARDPRAVDEGTVRAAQIIDHVRRADAPQPRMSPRDLRIGQRQVIARVASNGDDVLVERQIGEGDWRGGRTRSQHRLHAIRDGCSACAECGEVTRPGWGAGGNERECYVTDAHVHVGLQGRARDARAVDEGAVCAARVRDDERAALALDARVMTGHLPVRQDEIAVRATPNDEG